MTPEWRFFVLAWLALALFGAQVLLAGMAGPMQTREWREARRPAALQTFERFLLMIGVLVPPAALAGLLALLALVVLLSFLELAPGMTFGAFCAAGAFLLVAYRGIEAFCGWRTARLERRLPDAIDVMTGALAAGVSPRKALEAVVQWSEGPARREFAEIVSRLDLGFDIDQALGRMSKLYDSEGVRLFSQALRAKWHVGGDLAQGLTATNRAIHERLKMRMEAEGRLAGVRHAALFVAFMPHVMYGFFLFSQPQWVAAIHASPAGGPLIYGALALQLLGFLWVSRTLRSER